jgi:hypothetical protein
MVAFTIPSRTGEFTLQFLQQEWINDGNFMGLSRERDPNVGLQDEGAIFTIPKDRSVAASTISRRSTWFAAASICSCRACRH